MIPTWIHQTWRSKQDVEHLSNTWTTYHPGFKYTFYDDNAIDIFVRKYFDTRIYSVYKRITNGSLKADFFRYCVLYIHGGVYVDIDITCIKPLTEGIVDFEMDTLVTASDFQEKDYQPYNNGYRRDCIYQAFLCAQPFHPFIKYMLNYMCFIINNNQYKHDIFRIGGPEAFANGYDIFYNNTRPKHFTLRESNNHIFSDIKLVSHIHDCEYLGYNRHIFAKCQHVIPRDHNPHYNSNYYINKGLYH